MFSTSHFMRGSVTEKAKSRDTAVQDCDLQYTILDRGAEHTWETQFTTVVPKVPRFENDATFDPFHHFFLSICLAAVYPQQDWKNVNAMKNS